MNFNGLQDFKVTLAQEISTINKKNIINKNIQNDEPALDTAKKLLSSNVTTLENTVFIIFYVSPECKIAIINSPSSIMEDIIIIV